MPENFDDYDRRLLTELQRDAGRPVEALADVIGLSRNATWRRIRRLEEQGVVTGRVALVDPEKLGLGLTVFISVRTDRHDAAWAEDLTKALKAFPQIIGAYRTSGDLDYLIHARVPDVRGYDDLYRALIKRIPLKDVSASFVMEEMIETTALPV